MWMGVDDVAHRALDGEGDRGGVGEPAEEWEHSSGG